MKRPILPIFLAALFLAAPLASAWAQNATLTIESGPQAAKISPMHYGLMTEEINHSYDGGLYAELIRNRAFRDDTRTPAHWSVVQEGGSAARITLDPEKPLNTALPISLRLEVSGASQEAPAGVAND